jgi:hypothetical protein
MVDPITITVEQAMHEVAKFNFILEEGRKGNHLLFSPEMIRGAFQHPTADLGRLFHEKLDEINVALNKTFALASFEEKRGFIATLPAEVQSALVYGYFQLLEGSSEAVGEPRTIN